MYVPCLKSKCCHFTILRCSHVAVVVSYTTTPQVGNLDFLSFIIISLCRRWMLLFWRHVPHCYLPLRPGHTVQFFLQCCTQQDFLEVSHDAVCCAQLYKSRTRFYFFIYFILPHYNNIYTSATVARTVARKVTPCVHLYRALLHSRARAYHYTTELKVELEVHVLIRKF